MKNCNENDNKIVLLSRTHCDRLFLLGLKSDVPIKTRYRYQCECCISFLVFPAMLAVQRCEQLYIMARSTTTSLLIEISVLLP